MKENQHERNTLWGVLLTTITMVVEIVFGITTKSMALLSDYGVVYCQTDTQFDRKEARNLPLLIQFTVAAHAEATHKSLT